MIARCLLAALAASSAAIAYAAAPDGNEPEAAEVAASRTEAVAEPEDERKICRTERVTGSLTRRSRICLTEAQWREVHDRTRRGVGDLQNSASGAPRCINAMDVSCGAPGAGGM